MLLCFHFLAATEEHPYIMAQVPTCLVYIYQLNFLFCPQLILQVNWALPIEKFCLSLSPLPQHHPCVWL